MFIFVHLVLAVAIFVLRKGNVLTVTSETSVEVKNVLYKKNPFNTVDYLGYFF